MFRERSQNLQHLFHDGEQKYSGEEAEGSKIERGACLSAGTMGGGIAWLMADQGMRPVMKVSIGTR